VPASPEQAGWSSASRGPSDGRERILCVDDEPRILNGLRRRLQDRFVVTVAPDGAAGLELLERQGPFAVVVSDMRMPGMDGAAFLKRVRARTADTVRILLTGHADVEAAIAAVNDGNVFRFLTKPCPPEVLISALDGAVRQYRSAVDARLERARLVQDLQVMGQLKSQFLATVSHELRTPFNVIFGYAGLLRDGAEGQLLPGQLAILDRLEHAARELFETVEHILQARSLSRGGPLLVKERVPLDDLAHLLQESAGGLEWPPAVRVEWDLPRAPVGALMTDRETLRVVARNLLSNACKFTERGRVRVRMWSRDETLIIEVVDTGIGVPREHLAGIFEPLRQLENATSRHPGGVGLGLYLVQEYVSRLGGTVEVESAVGEGSTFRVILPGYSPAVPASDRG
jgi:signal transduction histidine kinase